MDITNQKALEWVNEITKLTKPEKTILCDGSRQQYNQFIKEAVESGVLIELNQEKLPNCYLHRSHPTDVARTEQCTFICTPSKTDAGPTNNWMPPDEMYSKLTKLFDGSMKGKTMYVIPYLMGPPNSHFSKVGIQLTDNIYVAISMMIMTRAGNIALQSLGDSDDFVKCLHSVGTFDPDNKFISHFPQDNAIWSINSGYGGNALLSKKCFSLRIASYRGYKEGWLAEHMLLMGIEKPNGETVYIAGAFPSACGKTNLAMLKPSNKFSDYKVWCLGDDICWLNVGADGRFWAINPEAGFFGVAPGTSLKTNPNMMNTINRNTLFTNVVLKPDKTVWWEGMDESPPTEGCLDWRGKPWRLENGHKGAHPNSRFTTPITQCPSFSEKWNDPQGVPVSAIIFGCRRSKLAPLIFEAYNWQHGVYLGATLASETTAAATGQVGVVRRDPMAMLPFCGYNMADYFRHWLSFGKRLSNPPRIFRINWFKLDENGKFLWPGFQENIRILKWIIERCEGKAKAVETPLGYMPSLDALDLDGLNISPDAIKNLLHIDKQAWLNTAYKQTEFFEKFGDRLPKEILDEQKALIRRLHEML